MFGVLQCSSRDFRRFSVLMYIMLHRLYSLSSFFTLVFSQFDVVIRQTFLELLPSGRSVFVLAPEPPGCLAGQHAAACLFWALCRPAQACVIAQGGLLGATGPCGQVRCDTSLW